MLPSTEHPKHNYLHLILKATHQRVARQKKTLPIALMRDYFEKSSFEKSSPSQPPFAFELGLTGAKDGSAKDIAIIAEIKKKSPSKGLISADFPFLQIAKAYEEGGASAISVLTEPEFFQGSDSYLQAIRAQTKIPLLRKDFIIDAYQIFESKYLGADAILLIVNILTDTQLQDYLAIADFLGLSALVEVHDSDEIQRALAVGARVIGVNNRNLKTFEVNIHNALSLREKVPDGIVFISESGIQNAQDISLLRQGGVDAALVGEVLMRASDKKSALQALLHPSSSPFLK